MTLFDVFTPKNQTYFLNSNSTIRQALEKFDAHKFSVVCLIDDEGKFVSTVSEGDILRYIKNVANFEISKAEHTLIIDIEKYRPYKPVNINAPIEQAYELALSQNFVPVIDDRGIYIGIIKRNTVIKMLIEK